MYETPDDTFTASKKKKKYDDISAVLTPSSVVHKSSPQVTLRQTSLNPTSADTDKDTAHLVEEDKSEC